MTTTFEPTFASVTSTSTFESTARASRQDLPVREGSAIDTSEPFCVAIDVTGEGFPRTVMLGDLGAEPQAALLRRVDVPRVEIVKVSHHGSADQDPALYERLHADLGLIGVGAGNTYGHPTEHLLDILRANGAVAARTDTDGMLAVWRGDEGRLTLWRQRAP